MSKHTVEEATERMLEILETKPDWPPGPPDKTMLALVRFSDEVDDLEHMAHMALCVIGISRGGWPSESPAEFVKRMRIEIAKRQPN